MLFIRSMLQSLKVALSAIAALFFLPVLLPTFMLTAFFFYGAGKAGLFLMVKLALVAGSIMAAIWLGRTAWRGDLQIRRHLEALNRGLAPAMPAAKAVASSLRRMRWPHALIWFVLTALIFLVQTSPSAGIILLFLLAPFWSIATFNAGFVHLAIESLSGHVSPRWMAVPILWYCGYLGIAAHGHLALYRLATQSDAENARQASSFDPARQALVIVGSGVFGGPIAGALLANYQLPVVYEQERPSRPSASGPQPRLMAVRLGPADFCDRLGVDVGLKAIGAHGFKQSVKGVAACVYSLPEQPAMPSIVVGHEAEPVDLLGVNGQRIQMRIKSEGLDVTMNYGNAGALAYLPMPVTECSYSWPYECHFRFLDDGIRFFGLPAGARDATELFARAFGLRTREAPPLLSPPPVEGALATQEDGVLLALDRLLEAPVGDPARLNLDLILARPAALTSRAERIASAAAVAIEAPGNGFNVSTLETLLVNLPEADFQRVGPRLVAALLANNATIKRCCGSKLTERFGDLGAQSLPLLEKLFFSNGATVPEALGFCRIGAPASALTERVSGVVRGEYYRRRSDDLELNKALVLALLRQGRPGLAEKMRQNYLDWASKDHGTPVTSWSHGGDPLEMGVTPQSAREVCTLPK